MTGNCESMSGCDRFPGACSTITTVILVLTCAIVLGIAGAVVSEKTIGMLAICSMSTMCGFIAFVSWLGWSKTNADHVELELISLGPGGWLIMGGCIAGVLAILSMIGDWWSTEGEPWGGDLLSTNHRLGSFGCVCIYFLLFLAVTDPQWTAVDDLGRLGGFCTSGSGCGKAKLGLWMYCVEENVPWFPDGPVDVCLKYTDLVTVSNGRTATSGNIDVAISQPGTTSGNARRNAVDDDGTAPSAANVSEIDGSYEEYAYDYSYANYFDALDEKNKPTSSKEDGSSEPSEQSPLVQLDPAKLDGEEKPNEADDVTPPTFDTRDGNSRFSDIQGYRTWTMFAVMGSAAAAIVCDVFSEKHKVGTPACLVAAVGGIIATVLWGILQKKLKEELGVGKLAMSSGSAIVIISWLVALGCMVAYGSAWLGHERAKAAKLGGSIRPGQRSGSESTYV